MINIVCFFVTVLLAIAVTLALHKALNKLDQKVNVVIQPSVIKDQWLESNPKITSKSSLSPEDMGYVKITDINKDAILLEPGRIVWIFFSDIVQMDFDKKGNLVEKKDSELPDEVATGWIKASVGYVAKGVTKDSKDGKTNELLFTLNPTLLDDPNSTTTLTFNLLKDTDSVELCYLYQEQGEHVNLTKEDYFHIKITEIWVK